MTTVHLLAVDWDAGWAFVRTDERTILLRPPFEQLPIEVNASAVDNAVLRFGFHAAAPAESSYASLGALIDSLRQGMRAAAESGGWLPSENTAKLLLRHAPEDTLEAYLERLENETIATGKLRHAEALLSAMLDLERVQQSLVLLRRVSRLLARTAEARENRQVEFAALGQSDDVLTTRFPSACKAYGTDGMRSISRVIRDRRQVLRPRA